MVRQVRSPAAGRREVTNRGLQLGARRGLKDFADPVVKFDGCQAACGEGVTNLLRCPVAFVVGDTEQVVGSPNLISHTNNSRRGTPARLSISTY